MVSNHEQQRKSRCTFDCLLQGIYLLVTFGFSFVQQVHLFFFGENIISIHLPNKTKKAEVRE